jgi:hypothetical protein
MREHPTGSRPDRTGARPPGVDHNQQIIDVYGAVAIDIGLIAIGTPSVAPANPAGAIQQSHLRTKYAAERGAVNALHPKCGFSPINV